MKASFIAIAFGAAAVVNAQFGLPPCVLQCVSKLSAEGASKCSLLDIGCQCKDTAFQAKSAACFKETCGADFDKAVEAGSKLCLDAGVTVVLPTEEPTPEPTPELTITATPEPTTLTTTVEETETETETPAPEEPETTEAPTETDETTLITVTKCPTTTETLTPPPATNGTNTTTSSPPIETAPESGAAALKVGSVLVLGAFAALFSL